MKYDIALIIPNLTITNSARRIIRDMGYEYPVYHAAQKNALRIAEFLRQKGCRIIISVGVTAQYLSENSPLLTLELQYSGLEFASAIMQAHTISDKIAIIGSKSLNYAAQRTLESLELNVPIFELNADEPIEQQAEKILNSGYEVIISGTPSVTIARRQGKIGIIPDIDSKQLEATLQHACQILNLLKESEEKYQTIKTLLNFTSESIIGTDCENRIVFINAAAQNLLSVEVEQVLNRNINELLAKRHFYNVLNSSEQSSPPDSNSIGVIINTLPIITDDRPTGFVYTIKLTAEIQQLESRIRKELRSKGHIARMNFKDIIGSSPALMRAKETAMKYSQYNCTVLIQGETGTGKEIFAQSIHNNSPRRNEAFVAVNCATIPDNLLESELFGYEKGAFTGARNDGKIGLFEMAHNGSIFLDEISELPINLQSHLLRVLQEKEVRRIGGEKVIPLDVRIMASSNKPLLDLVEAGTFREDLYYRLSILELNLPPLRDRLEDIRPLCEQMISKYNREFNKNIRGMTNDFLEALKSLEWKGNVRQLGNLMQRLILLAKSEYLDLALLETQDSYKNISYNISPDLHQQSLKVHEYELIQRVLKETNGNRAAAARILGINPSTLWRKLKSAESSTK